jgi:ADP-ribosyl-[dinitrogen reductase] hydrolase
MALCIMDSYVRKGGYDLGDVGATFVKWLREGYLSSVEGKSFDVGGATYDGVEAIARGSLVNGEEESQGNGSLMRFAPSYLIARAEGRDEIMYEVSDLTHASRKVRAVCDEMAGILDLHMKGERYKDTLAAGLERAKVPNSGWVVDTLVAAKWAFVTTQTFEEGMIAAVNLGGDADSIGAVFGQMAGAYYGYRAIPERWVKEVKDWKKIDKRIEDFLAAVGM